MPQEPTYSRRVRLQVSSPVVTIAAVLAIVAASFTLNPWEAVWSALLLFTIVRVFWWKHQPGILLVTLLIPFSEVHTVILESNNFELDLDILYPIQGARSTFWLASIGVLMVAAGLRMGLRPSRHFKSIQYKQVADASTAINQTRLLLTLAILSAGGLILDRLIPYGSSLQQIETYYSGISVALFVCYALLFWIQRKKPLLFLLVFLLILINSFYSYFSSWTIPFMVLGMTYLVTISTFKTPQLLRTLPIAIPALALILIWQSVKADYREFLSDGQRTQAVLVSRNQALFKFSELASNAITEERYFEENVIADTYRRAGYLEYFNAARLKVPSEIAHRNGALFLESMSFALIPRILNPNKGVKDDKAKVEYYTDFYFGENSFASFSLGHYCEAFIDWGPTGMMFHLFAYGLFGALLFRVTLHRCRQLNPLITFGILWSVMYPWGTCQSDMVTVLGSTVWGGFSQLVLFFPLYKWINTFIQSAPASAEDVHLNRGTGMRRQLP